MLLRGEADTLPLPVGDMVLLCHLFPSSVHCHSGHVLFPIKTSRSKTVGLDPETMDKSRAGTKVYSTALSIRGLSIRNLQTARKLSIKRVLPTYAATATSVPVSTVATGSKVFASTIAR